MLDKAEKSAAAARTLTNQLLYDHLLVVNSVPLNGDFFDWSTVSQNIFTGDFHRVETASVFWWSDTQTDGPAWKFPACSMKHRRAVTYRSAEV